MESGRTKGKDKEKDMESEEEKNHRRREYYLVMGIHRYTKDVDVYLLSPKTVCTSGHSPQPTRQF